MTEEQGGAGSGSTTTTTPGNGENLPAVKDPYQEIFVPMQQRVFTRLSQLAESVEDAVGKQLITSLVKSANPKKKGREEMDKRWSIPVIRIVHGVTRKRPEGAETGDLYTTNGFVLKQPFKITPIYIYQMNQMFAKGGSARGRTCFAPDAKYGRPFGKCSECPHLPQSKNPTGTKTDCDNGICMIVLAQDLKLYRVEFFKTSRRAGENLDMLADATENLWDRWYSLKTQIQQYEGNEWHTFETMATSQETAEYARDVADTLYDLVYAERKAFVAQHYAIIQSDEEATGSIRETMDASVVVDPNNPDVSDNPDI